MVPQAHPNPQSKRYIDLYLFSRFCTAHHIHTLQWAALCPSKLPFPSDVDPI